ncbi:hypothetical protein [Devosia sp. Root105]|uniref:hypothetical protein n=1 Tax=Devosia sp. Root105 TaxID=1736423 RepID=UPI0012E35F8A|nr:hypothetical protein [Devosia sp. Root105]
MFGDLLAFGGQTDMNRKLLFRLSLTGTAAVLLLLALAYWWRGIGTRGGRHAHVRAAARAQPDQPPVVGDAYSSEATASH